MATLSNGTVKKIILKLLKGKDYRIEIVELINASFMEYSLGFFKRVANAKLDNENINTDWYKKEFLNEKLSAEDFAIHAGLNKKTIANMYNCGKKEIVITASKDHYDQLCATLQNLVEDDSELDLSLTIKFNQVSVELNISESLIVINSLAVKRAALRGGLWSTAGKRVEKPLMLALCKLYGVKEEFYIAEDQRDTHKNYNRETDFYLCYDKNTKYRCEVKLIGKGNPESADAVYPRGADIFVADKLSETNKKQLDANEIHWIELRSKDGFRKFEEILTDLKIPHSPLPDEVNYEDIIDKVLSKLHEG